MFLFWLLLVCFGKRSLIKRFLCFHRRSECFVFRFSPPKRMFVRFSRFVGQCWWRNKKWLATTLPTMDYQLVISFHASISNQWTWNRYECFIYVFVIKKEMIGSIAQVRKRYYSSNFAMILAKIPSLNLWILQRFTTISGTFKWIFEWILFYKLLKYVKKVGKSF